MMIIYSKQVAISLNPDPSQPFQAGSIGWDDIPTVEVGLASYLRLVFTKRQLCQDAIHFTIFCVFTALQTRTTESATSESENLGQTAQAARSAADFNEESAGNFTREFEQYQRRLGPGLCAEILASLRPEIEGLKLHLEQMDAAARKSLEDQYACVYAATQRPSTFEEVVGDISKQLSCSPAMAASALRDSPEWHLHDSSSASPSLVVPDEASLGDQYKSTCEVARRVLVSQNARHVQDAMEAHASQIQDLRLYGDSLQALSSLATHVAPPSHVGVRFAVNFGLNLLSKLGVAVHGRLTQAAPEIVQHRIAVAGAVSNFVAPWVAFGVGSFFRVTPQPVPSFPVKSEGTSSDVDASFRLEQERFANSSAVFSSDQSVKHLGVLDGATKTARQQLPTQLAEGLGPFPSVLAPRTNCSAKIEFKIPLTKPVASPHTEDFSSVVKCLPKGSIPPYREMGSPPSIGLPYYNGELLYGSTNVTLPPSSSEQLTSGYTRIEYLPQPPISSHDDEAPVGRLCIGKSPLQFTFEGHSSPIVTSPVHLNESKTVFTFRPGASSDFEVLRAPSSQVKVTFLGTDTIVTLPSNSESTLSIQQESSLIAALYVNGVKVSTYSLAPDSTSESVSFQLLLPPLSTTPIPHLGFSFLATYSSHLLDGNGVRSIPVISSEISSQATRMAVDRLTAECSPAPLSTPVSQPDPLEPQLPNPPAFPRLRDAPVPVVREVSPQPAPVNFSGTVVQESLSQLAAGVLFVLAWNIPVIGQVSAALAAVNGAISSLNVVASLLPDSPPAYPPDPLYADPSYDDSSDEDSSLVGHIQKSPTGGNGYVRIADTEV